MKHALDGEVDRKFHVPHMAYVVYIFIYVCHMFITPRMHGRFYRPKLKRKWQCWKIRHRYAKFSNGGGKNPLQIRSHSKEIWTYMQPAWWGQGKDAGIILTKLLSLFWPLHFIMAIPMKWVSYLVGCLLSHCR